MDWTLKDKTVLLTGGSRGIGKTLACQLAQRGARIAVIGKTMEKHPRLDGTLPETVAAIERQGGTGIAIQADVRHAEQVSAAVETCVEYFGTVDVCIHNAGALWWKRIEDTPPSKFDLVMGVNGRAAHLLAHYAQPYLCDGSGGHFLVMSPPIDPRLTAGKSAYMASKFAMTFTAFAVAEEWSRFRVSSNALWPETLIQSAATETYQIGNERHWYKSELVSDAAISILEKKPMEQTGQSLLAMAVLRAKGVNDFTPYRCHPDAEPPVLTGFKLPTIGGKQLADGHVTE